MRFFIYNLLLWGGTPWAVLYLLCVGRYRRLLQRFRPAVPQLKGAPIWIHACSVGEVNVAKGMITEYRQRFSDMPVLLSVSTISGMNLAQSIVQGVPVVFAPFDVAMSVRAFLRQVRPSVLVLIETEIWPNLVRETRRYGAPVVVVNGRISPRKYPRYSKYAWVLPPVFPLLSAVGAQNEAYAERFRRLGVLPSRITITGNMKCDVVADEVAAEVLEEMRQVNGFSAQDMVLVFGSTRPGDEQLAAYCWKSLKELWPGMRLVIAPRHLERLAEALAPLENEPVLLRSEVLVGKGNRDARVFVLDTIGELRAFYALATVAVIGGSFYRGVEGHNPLESAALGTPTVFGPYMGNFPDAAGMLLEKGGAVQVPHPDALVTVLRQLLADPSRCTQLGVVGKRVVRDNQGAIAKNVTMAVQRIETDGSV